jgi:hypothetical protein
MSWPGNPERPPEEFSDSAQFACELKKGQRTVISDHSISKPRFTNPIGRTSRAI